MLTKAQKKEIEETQKIVDLLGLDLEAKNIESFEKEARLYIIKSIKDHYIRGEVILTYTLIDEYLNVLIANYFFKKEKSKIKNWRKTQKFQIFNNFILEKTYLIHKAQLVSKFVKIPTDIHSNIAEINNLRNGLAHSFFPNARNTNKPFYKGKSVYSLEGFEKYLEERRRVTDFLFKKAYNLDISNISFRI